MSTITYFYFLEFFVEKGVGFFSRTKRQGARCLETGGKFGGTWGVGEAMTILKIYIFFTVLNVLKHCIFLQKITAALKQTANLSLHLDQGAC